MTNRKGERQRRSDGLDLTPRELSVIDLLREGKPNKLIGRELEMQESTVKAHVRNILKKPNARNRTHAALVANRLLGSGSADHRNIWGRNWLAPASDLQTTRAPRPRIDDAPKLSD